MTPVSIAGLNLLLSLLVLGLKYVAFRLTGSVSLYSDALESIVNVVAAFVAFLAVRISVLPPDKNHPFGHTKVEYFSAVIEGALILFAAIEIARAAWSRFIHPVALEQVGTGLAISVGATLLNGAWAALLVRTGRKSRSPALVADGKHLFTDVITTIGVLAGIGIASMTGWWILDPLLAIAMAGNIVFVGLHLVRESVGGLMDVVVPESDMAIIHKTIHEHMGDALEVHALRTRQAGSHTFIEFHLVLPDEVTVGESHLLCDQLEGALRQAIPQSSITIHVEPEYKRVGGGDIVQFGYDVPDTES